MTTLLAATLIGFTATPQMGGGIAVSPLMFRVAVPGAQLVRLPVDVTNLGSANLETSIRVRSVSYTSGSYRANVESRNPADCSTWFRQRDLLRTVRPGTTETFQLEVQVPRVGPGCYYCVATVTPRVAGRTDLIVTSYQIPVILLVGRQGRVDIKLGSPEVAGGASPTLRIPFENVGTGFTTIGTSVTVRTKSTGRIERTFLDTDRNLFPGTQRNLTFSLDGLDRGVYVVQARSQAGTRVFPTLTREIEITGNGARAADKGQTFELAPVTIEPSFITQQMPAGASRSVAVRIKNNSNAAATFQVTTGKLVQSATGGFIVDPTAKSDVKVEPTNPVVTIRPGAVASVALRVSSDKAVTGEYWFGVAIRSRDGAQLPEEVYGRVVTPRGTPKLEVSSATVERPDGIPNGVRFEVRNTGTQALKPIPSATLYDKANNALATLQAPVLGDGGILPGATLRNYVQIPPGLPPGDYVVGIQYQYGEELFAQRSVNVTVPARR